MSPNTRDTVKIRICSRNHELCQKHFLDMTQKKLFSKFKNENPKINITQIFFEMNKPFYVKINHSCTTCCRRHVEFSMHYDVFSQIRCVFHTDIMLQECELNVPPKSTREFIPTIFCEKSTRQLFYNKTCLDGTCNVCGGLPKLKICIDEKSIYSIGK